MRHGRHRRYRHWCSVGRGIGLRHSCKTCATLIDFPSPLCYNRLVLKKRSVFRRGHQKDRRRDGREPDHRGRDLEAAVVFLFPDFVQTVIGNDKGHEQADQAEREGAKRRDIRQNRNKPPQNRPQRWDRADHGKRDDVKDRVRHNAKPEILSNFVHNRNEMLLDPFLNFFHPDPPRLTRMIKVDGILKDTLAVQRAV